MRAVFFDVDGVLVQGYHARPEYRHCWDEHIERDFGIDRDRFTNEFIFGPFVREVIVGRRDLKEALAEFLPSQGFSGDPQVFIDYWMKNDSNVYHDLFTMIRQLKNSGKVRLFIATNQEHNRARYLMDVLGFREYFEDIFYSARLGVLKPDPCYFAQIEKLAGLKEGEKPIFFDDTPAVVEGARSAGWEAIEFLHPFDLHKHDYIRTILEGNSACEETT